MRTTLCPLIVVLLIVSLSAGAQTPDSVRLTLPEAENIFLQKNLSLLAQQYNVDIGRALVQQAKYWDNPVLNTDQNIYDGRFFRHNKDFGQVYLQLQQVIKTAGKRNKLVQLANDDVLTAEQQLNDLLRNLRFVLRNDFITLARQFRVLSIYNNEAAALQQLSAGMDAQLQAGNISRKDNLRIKALLFSLQSDIAGLQLQITDTEKELATLLQAKADTVFIPLMNNQALTVPSFTMVQLLDTALANRPDIKLAQTNFISRQHNLSYQKSLVVPDVTVGMEYDQRSSYAPNLWGLGVSIPLPVLNKNKGNIRAAQVNIQQAAVRVKQVQSAAEQEVGAAWRKLLSLQQLRQSMQPGFMSQYDELLQNMIQSYGRRQIGLLEFIDFFDAYKEASLKQLQQEADMRSAAEELNYSVGTTLINIQ